MPRRAASGSEGSAAGGLEVRVLGPVELASAGRAVHIGSPKQRAVFALLALHAGRVVSSDALCDLVWDETQPSSPSATLHSLVSRIRGALAGPPGARSEAARDLLRTRDPGWVLDIDPSAVDALRFGQLVARARQRSARGDAGAAAGDLADALGMWRGPALVDLVDAGYLGSHATRLNEARLEALEDLADAELQSGHAAEALARLEEHVDANPLRERGWSLLMVALYRLGRQAAALRAFQQVRTILRDEVGLEPSPDLVSIEQQILRHDPALAGPSPAGIVSAIWPSDAPPPPAPEQPSALGAPVPAAGTEFADFSVVVVEDHDFQRRTVVQLLRGLGVGAVSDLASGDEALRLLEAGSTPDIVICDIDMPGMDGVEFVTNVAERNLACAVVIASGLGSNVVRAVEAIAENHGLHVLAALEKPLTARRLGDALSQYTRLNDQRADASDAAAISGDDLRSALESGELRAQFQPRIALATGAMSSAEVRAHWQRHDGFTPSPSAILRALAREDLLVEFVDRAVADVGELVDAAKRAGLDIDSSLRVALDVSLLQFEAVSFADAIADIARRHGQEHHRFVWEINDVILARASGSASAPLTRLRVKGFGLALRHTGTGPAWTSLAARVPLSELTLDRQLVTGAAVDQKRLARLEGALAEARDMGLPVVADGCDSREDLDMLLALGCSEAQGHLVGDAMPATDVMPWALSGRAP